MKMQRILALGLAFVMLVALMTACGSPSKNEASTSSAVVSQSSSTPAPAAKVNRFGWEIPEKTLEIRVFNATGNDAPSDAQKVGRENVAKYFLDNFNVKIEQTFSSGDGVEALNLALASGEYPDIISNMANDMLKQFKDQGRVKEVTPFMDTVGKDIKQSLGKDYNLYLDESGKLWGIPLYTGTLKIPDFSAYVRYDEWTALGSPQINTPDDYKKYLYDELKKTPKTPAGETRYALSFFNQGNPERIGGLWGLKQGFLQDETNNTFTYFCFTEQGKAMTKWLNSFYREGTLDPDSFINTFDDWKAKFSRERIIGGIGAWWTVYNAGHEIWSQTDPNWNDNKRFIQIVFQAPEAKAIYMSPKSGVSTNYTVITDKATDVEGIMKFINFEATDTGRALINWGIPNGEIKDDKGQPIQFWTIDESGKWEVDPKAKANMVAENFTAQNMDYSLGAPVMFFTDNNFPDGVHNNNTNQMWYDENKWKSILINNCSKGIYDATPMVFVTKDEKTATLETAKNDAWKTFWTKCVLAKNDAQFESAWKALQDAETNAGIKEYQDIYAKNYAHNLEIMNK